MLIRHDTIKLLPGVTESEFEQFMTRDLIPYISEAFKGPTRSSVADIKAQSLLKATGDARQYLWVTTWDGSTRGVEGENFESARMSPTTATSGVEFMLRKLDRFGRRAGSHVFDEQASVGVATNQ